MDHQAKLAEEMVAKIAEEVEDVAAVMDAEVRGLARSLSSRSLSVRSTAADTPNSTVSAELDQSASSGRWELYGNPAKQMLTLLIVLVVGMVMYKMDDLASTVVDCLYFAVIT